MVRFMPWRCRRTHSRVTKLGVEERLSVTLSTSTVISMRSAAMGSAMVSSAQFFLRVSAMVISSAPDRMIPPPSQVQGSGTSPKKIQPKPTTGKRRRY